jgi:predicted small lipoprotein YifL
MRHLSALLALLLLAGTLGACGRMGNIRPPGPPDQVTWPRVYPSR